MVDQGPATAAFKFCQEQHALSIRTATLDVEQRTQLQNALSEKLSVLIRKPRLTQLVPPLVANFRLWVTGPLSFAGIIIYISLRYKLDFAVLAIVALFHDARLGFFVGSGGGC